MSKEKRNYKLYVHINKVNNKKYYGITSQSIKRRWRNNGNGYKPRKNKNGELKGNTHFWNSICKYGWDNFEHIVLFEELTKEEAELMEKCYIALYDTTNEDYGYNMTEGGDGTNGCKWTEEMKKNKSESMKGEGNHFYGKHHTEETKKIISEKAKGREGYWKGKHIPQEAKDKISNANKGKKHSEETRKKWSKQRKGKKATEEAKKNISEGKKGEKNPMYGVDGISSPVSALYKVIKLNGEEEILCGNQIYNNSSNKKGFLNITIATFKKYIEPYGDIDMYRIINELKCNKTIIKKLTPYDGWKIIRIR